MNLFNETPTEVIKLIFSHLDFNDLSRIYMTSKSLNLTCEENIIPFTKEILGKKGIYVNNINSRDRILEIARCSHLNNNIYVEGLEDFTSNDYNKYIVGSDGKVRVLSHIDHEREIKILPNIKDIISIAGNNDQKYLFLRNDGRVNDVDPHNNIPIIKDISPMVRTSDGNCINNIVQIIQNKNNSFFLTF